MGSKKKKPFTLTPKLRSQSPRLVVYEIQMFLNGVRCLGVNLGILHPWLTLLFSNALLEATLVHARILLDFFEHKAVGRNADDIVSEDMGFPSKRIVGSGKLRVAINKRLAHLTYTRAMFRDAKNKGWPHKEFHPLVRRCCEFLNADIPNDLVGKHTSSETQGIWNDLKTQMAAVKT